MKAEHIIIIVIVIIIAAGIGLYLLKKKKHNEDSVTISIKTKSHAESRSVPTIKVESTPSASQEYVLLKKETVENIAERHKEAAKLIKESVNNLIQNSADYIDQKTKNESKLEEMRKDLENLYKG